MNQFAVAQGFIERCQAGAPADVLGFKHFACCLHVDALQPPRRGVMLYSYPMPACADELTPSQQEIFHEARRYGLARGYPMPIHGPSADSAERKLRATARVQAKADLFLVACEGTAPCAPEVALLRESPHRQA